MACYTIAELAKTNDERSTPWLTGQLEQLSNSPFYFARSALGDVLIDWSLNGHHDELNRLKIHENYWKPRWPYLEIDIIALIALAAIRPLNDAMLKSWGLNAYGDRIAKDRKFFKTANGWKNELLGKFVPSSKLWNLIENHFSSKVGDKTNPGTWPEMQALFRDDAPNGDDAFTLMRFLFSHPQWSGAERASAMLKHLATLPECRIRVFGVVDQFLSSKLKLNWRIVAGALDSTCLFCDIDDDETVRKPDNDKIGRPPKTERRRFEKNLLKKCYFAHPCCRVRSICAENFVADLLARNPSEWKSRLVDFEKPVLRWLADDDCWVLEHMYRLFHKPVHSLSKINDDDCNRSDPMKDELIAWMKERFVNLNPKSLLKKIGTGWHMSDREKFLANLERCREEKPKSS